ncbi:MAG: hypothetical protein AMJ54_15280 [Deltaproteobacteria bacterium SG8_13]|nr:MAG: hypothetical protein AMJ54_15280 [Deltaproteobacteria bacterium SG8_13]
MGFSMPAFHSPLHAVGRQQWLAVTAFRIRCAEEKPASDLAGSYLRRPPAGAELYTPQVWPSKPMVTLPPATMTGTLRTPSECFSIESMCCEDSSTSMYSTFLPCFAMASRAARVCGQVFLPKIFTVSDISHSSFCVCRVDSTGRRYSCCRMHL